MSLLAMLKPNGPSGFGYGSTAEGVTAGLSLDGRSYLLTGCNSGFGLESLRVLTLRGAHVIAAARTLEKARAACASVKGRTTPVACELAEPACLGSRNRRNGQGVEHSNRRDHQNEMSGVVGEELQFIAVGLVELRQRHDPSVGVYIRS